MQNENSEITAIGRTSADFIMAQEALKKIYLEKDRFAFFYFNGGIVNAMQSESSPEYNIFINIAFKLKEELIESDENKLIDIDKSGYFEVSSFSNLVKTLSLVSGDGRISTKTDDPSLLLIKSEVKMGMTLEHKNISTNNLILNAIVLDSSNFDSFKRKSILPENLPNIKKDVNG